MDAFLINMPFLYFPEDKSEYIPAFITMAFFVIGAIVTLILFKRISKKQELKTKELEERINRERQKEHQ
ncbi:hypothetical protein [Lederbergia graminis]|uniref:Uncharacterized protein n=1 Tax=Lederbergia graminis TaxID=735518 RepID=A0ABW0LH21_9BACI